MSINQKEKDLVRRRSRLVVTIEIDLEKVHTYVTVDFASRLEMLLRTEEGNSRRRDRSDAGG